MNAGPSQPHLTPDAVSAAGFQSGDHLSNSLLLQQLQQIQQYVETTQPEMLSGAPNSAPGGNIGNPEGNLPTTPQNILAALEHMQK